MQKLPNMVDMARSTEEKAESPSSISGGIPDYPYGLSLCFTQNELEKLNLDDDVQVGDYLHIFAFAKVTSVSKREIDGKEECRIEMTLTHIAAESEDEENEEYEEEEELSEKKQLGHFRPYS